MADQTNGVRGYGGKKRIVKLDLAEDDGRRDAILPACEVCGCRTSSLPWSWLQRRFSVQRCTNGVPVHGCGVRSWTSLAFVIAEADCSLTVLIVERLASLALCHCCSCGSQPEPRPSTRRRIQKVLKPSWSRPQTQDATRY